MTGPGNDGEFAKVAKVAQISAFDTDEQRKLYALAVGFGEASNIADEALTLLEVYAKYPGDTWRRLRALRERLDAVCRSVS
jgi:hypothetical protein